MNNRKQKAKVIAMALCVALIFQVADPVKFSALVNDEIQEQSTEEVQEESSAGDNETATMKESPSSEETKSTEESSSSEETKSTEESSSLEEASEEASEDVESSTVTEESSAVEETVLDEMSEVEETENETETEEESELAEMGAEEAGEPDVEGFAEAVLEGLRNKVDIIENLEQYNVTKDMGQTIYWNILYNNPDLYYIKSRVIIIDGQYVKTVTPYYYDNANDNEAYQKGKQDALSVVTSDMSNIQKAIVLHDWIITHVDYDYDSYNNNLLNEAHSAYGVFVNGSAVCQGICSAYKSLLDEIGIENYIVVNSSHAWNVLVTDGNYYHVDITQDNFDKSDSSYPAIGHIQFLVSNDYFYFSSKHSDYYMYKDYQEMDVPATSTTYDNAFWRYVYSPITAANGSFYYIKNNKLYKTSSYDNSSESIKITDVKTISESSTPYSGLFRMNDRIYFNDKYAVYSIALDGTDKRAEYQITDTSNGYISGIDRTGGQVYIELYKDGNFTKSNISLAGGNIELQPMEIGFENSEEEMYENDTLQLSVKAYPGGDISNVTWISDNTAVATVSDSGLVTPVSTGTAKITAEWNSMKAECTVTVKESSSSEEQHYVIFREPNGDFISSCYVKDGCDAPLPDFSAPDGYSLSWTENCINVKQNETVMAIFTPIEYDITYELDGGTNATANPPQYTIETDDIVLASPTKNGSAFGGWYYDSKYTIKVDIISKGSYGDITLYAKWITESSKQYLVTFKAPDGTVLKEEQVSEGRDATLPEYSAPNGYSVTWNGNYTNVQQNETVTAVLTPIEYNITYELDGGTNAAGNPSKYTIETENITLVSPTKDGMTFGGWYYESSFTTKVDVISKGSTGDITLYAKWMAESSNKYLITFKDPNGTVLKEEQVTEGHDATLPEYSVPNGYNVTWDGNYTNVRQDETVTAVLTPIEYNITYELDGGTNAAGNPSKYTIETDNIVLESPTKEGMIFDGWYRDNSFVTKVDVIPKGSYGDITLYAKWSGKDPEDDPNYRNGLWTEEIRDIYYTGSVIKPAPVVYDGMTRLVSGKDYSVSYKNNTNAGTAQVIITGKGNYKGNVTAEFRILPVDIRTASVYDMSVMYKAGKKQTPVPVVELNGKKLKNKKDFSVTYQGGCTEPGEYDVTVSGTGNYTGTRQIRLVIASGNEILISKASVSKIPDVTYTGNPVKVDESSITVKYKGKALEKGTDYEIQYGSYIDSGTYDLFIVGKGQYRGVKTVKFNIKGTAIKKATMTPLTVSYTGTHQIPDIKLTFEGKSLVYGTDYVTAFNNNVNKGKATIRITGMGRFSGTVTKTFNIAAQSISAAEISFNNNSFPYVKGGTVPEITVKCNGNLLRKGIDYTVTGKNNKKPGNATLVVKGIGNYSGTVNKSFTVTTQAISNVLLMVPDVEYTGKKGGYKTKPVLMDASGKKLGTSDYDSKNVIYKDASGNILDKNSVVNIGDIVSVTIKGKGNYSGEITGTYRVVPKGRSIAKAKQNKIVKEYTGKQVVLSKEDISLSIGGSKIPSDGFEIIPGSYVNNINKGTASVTVRGIGEYGGIKTITFKIDMQNLKWGK